jgi:hypothetical protein
MNEKTHIYCLVENNGWEGERWCFYFVMTELQLKQLTELVNTQNSINGTINYKILDKTFSRPEMLPLVENSHSGYLRYHNDCGTLTKELPEAIKDDPLYKGGIRDYCEELTLEQKGLINKYYVCKADGRECDPNAEYFVLRLDDGSTDPKHVEACRQAVLCYAEGIKDHLPQLHKDLVEKYGEGNETEI